MSITDAKINRSAAIARRTYHFNTASLGASVTAQALAKLKVGHGFEVVRVSAWARTISGGTVTVDVKIGNGGTDASCLTGPITPTSGTTDPQDGTLTTAVGTRRGTATQILTVYGTTGAGATITDLQVTVVVRPRPLNGES